MLRGPAVHIDTDLGDQPERTVGAQARQCGEVDPTTQREQGRTDLERRCVVLALALGTRFARGRPRSPWRLALSLKRVNARLDLLVTAPDRLVVTVVHLEFLTQHEEVFIARVPRERGGDLGFRCPALGVAMTSQHRGIGHAGHTVAQNQHPGDPGHVADHGVELEVHQRQRLLHPWETGGRPLHEGVSVAQQGPDGGDENGGVKLDHRAAV